MHNFSPKSTLPWLTAMLVVTIFSLTLYAVAQQNYRQNANDPQIQIAEDTAALLLNPHGESDYLTPAVIDIGQSLRPFTIVYDGGNNYYSGNAQLHGTPPSIPTGVIETARRDGQDRVTWQPEPNLRFAVVAATQRSSGLVVVVGRSLREVENRISQLGDMIFIAWAVSCALVLAAWWITTKTASIPSSVR